MNWVMQDAKSPCGRGLCWCGSSSRGTDAAGAWRVSVAPFWNDKTPPVFTDGVLGITSLTMTYFHRRPSTIIGAKAFHCPVRDGKEWFHLAMVVRHNLLAGCVYRLPACAVTDKLDNLPNLERSITIQQCVSQRLESRVILRVFGL